MKINNKLKLCIASAVVILLSVAVVFCVTAMHNDSDSNDEIFLELREKFNEIKSVSSAIDVDISFPEKLAESDKAAAREQLSLKMSDVFTTDSYLNNTYANALERSLAGENNPVSYVTVTGIFASDILSKTYENDGNTATVRFETIKWEKYINQGSVDSEYSVVFPVNKDITDIVFKKENGEWKIESYEILEHLMEGDYDLARSFSTYEEALEYSKSVMPENVFAK